MIDAFLSGLICSGSLVVGGFFLKFWRQSGDQFFLAFAASFIVEALGRALLLFDPRPNEGSLWIYLVRVSASLLIVVAIIKKNYIDR